LFGNFQFPRVRLLDPTDTRAQKTITWSRKLRFFVKEVAVPSWPLFLAFCAVAVAPAWVWLRRRERGTLRLGVLLLTLPFFLIGCFAPSRYQYQHYYVLIPFLTLGIVYGLQCESVSGRRIVFVRVLFPLVVVFSILLGFKDYLSVSKVFDRN